jgi:drug/metabolite transporter (DMT)-like permease
MEQHKPAIHPYLVLLIGVLSISTSAIFVKLTTSPAPITATYRLLFTVLLMTPIAIRPIMRELPSMNRSSWYYAVGSGFFLAIHFILWFESLNYTSVTSSVVLVCLQPLFSFIGGYYVFKEKLSIYAVMGGVLAFLGSVIIGWGDFQIGGMALFGDILALLAAGMVTGYWMIGQHMRKTMSLTTYTYIVYGLATLMLLVYDLTLGYSLYPYPAFDWLWFLSLAVFPTLLGHSLLNWVIKWVNASTVSMSILGEPIGSAILAYFILNEKIKPLQWIGSAVILCGIYLFLKNRSPKPESFTKAKREFTV